MSYAQAKVTIYFVKATAFMHILFHKVSDELRFGHLVGSFFVYPIRSIPLAYLAQVTPEKTGGVSAKLCAGDTGKSVHIYPGDQYIALISEPAQDSVAPQIVSMMPRYDYVSIMESMKPMCIEFSPDTVFELDIPAWSRKVTGTMLMIIDKLIGHVGSEVRSVIKNPDNKWWTKLEGEEEYTQVWPIIPEITQDYIASAMEHPAKPSIPKPSEKKVMKGARPKPPKKLTTTEKVPVKTAKKVAKKAATKRNG